MLQVLGPGCCKNPQAKSDIRKTNKSSSGIAKLLAMPTQNLTFEAKTRKSGGKVSKDDKGLFTEKEIWCFKESGSENSGRLED